MGNLSVLYSDFFIAEYARKRYWQDTFLEWRYRAIMISRLGVMPNICDDNGIYWITPRYWLVLNYLSTHEKNGIQG